MSEKSMAELERELLAGAIDMHVHTTPCPFPRRFDDAEAASLAKDLGMRAMVVKDHHQPTVGRVHHARKLVPDFELLGSVVLNSYLGGLNPYAVEAAVRFYDARVVWLPTITSRAHLDHFGKPGFTSYSTSFRPVSGLELLQDGQLKPEVKEIIEICSEADVCLATGHITVEEIRAVIEEAVKLGLSKLVVTHALFVLPGLSLEQQKEFAAVPDVFIEFTFLPMTPLWQRGSRETAEAIKAVGPENCIMSSDLGNYLTPSPPEGLRCFIQNMLHCGISPADVELMVKKNPAHLLNLD